MRTWCGFSGIQLRVGSLYLVTCLRLMVIAPSGAGAKPSGGGPGMLGPKPGPALPIGGGGGGMLVLMEDGGGGGGGHGGGFGASTGLASGLGLSSRNNKNVKSINLLIKQNHRN